MCGGLLGDLFDFDGDGKLNCLEQAAELTFLTEIIEQEERESHNKTILDDNSRI